MPPAPPVSRAEVEELVALARSQAGLDALGESIDALPYEMKRRVLSALGIQVRVYVGGRSEIDGALPLPAPDQDSNLKYL